MASRKGEKRSYQDGCAAAHALDLIGERWALLVVRELLLGPRRFTDLKTSLPGISATVLAQRLSDLEGTGVLTCQPLPAPAAGWMYALTPWGHELEPVLQQLGRWGAQSPHKAPAPISLATLITAQKTMFSAQAATGIAGAVALQVGRERFTARIESGTLDITPGGGAADATLSGDVATLGRVLLGDQSIGEAEAAGLLSVLGDRALAQRYATLFPLPTPVASPERR
ncbi:winged helix-turn-helix transcriptional regulator [Deinococcus alpinitundrae]|uniref:winged helix-turn-helix transcriptional regulator n=1 Tax=Deinococcus alpinitundrae TaxID=468913 RepID=UPI001379F06A|nr:winged helix-turn-helix transcriptional regulator [Deinococcus alpinitundrae]